MSGYKKRLEGKGARFDEDLLRVFEERLKALEAFSRTKEKITQNDLQVIIRDLETTVNGMASGQMLK